MCWVGTWELTLKYRFGPGEGLELDQSRCMKGSAYTIIIEVKLAAFNEIIVCIFVITLGILNDGFSSFIFSHLPNEILWFECLCRQS